MEAVLAFAVVLFLGTLLSASVVCGLLILKFSVPAGEHLFHLVALVVVASILAHSSTDVVMARWFRAAEHGPQVLS